MKNKELAFEDKLDKLQDIVDTLDKGDAPLEHLIIQFEDGMKIAKELREYLETIEGKIIDITQKHTQKAEEQEESEEED